MRRGIFGGSFNPVHNGHIAVAEAAARQLGIDDVHLVPVHEQPFKRGTLVASADDRLAMLGLAVEGHPLLLVDDRELRRAGVSYTIDTLRELTAEFPDDSLSLMVGADAARDIASWREAEAIASLAEVVALPRQGSEIPVDGLISRVAEVSPVDVSASDVRARVRRGESISDLVPLTVASYIAERGLYMATESKGK